MGTESHVDTNGNGNGNGSSGRFLRIEDKIDTLIEDLGDFKVAVTERLVSLEAVSSFKREQKLRQVSDRSFNWMRVGIFSSIGVGLVTLIARLFGIG